MTSLGHDRILVKLRLLPIKIGNRMDDRPISENRLGSYLRARRSRLEPAALGFPADKRRTPGLRREEVALRASISPTWYAWLEQGRGGPPSPEVLNRLARALMLTDREREHLFLIGIGRPPEARYHESEGVTPRLQHVLDRLEPSPALIRTAAWDVVAWNLAATRMFGDYASMAGPQRNMLRTVFLSPNARSIVGDWESAARFVVGAFRIDAARIGATPDVRAIIDELSLASPEFKAMWLDNDVSAPGESVKHVQHPDLGQLSFEYSTFAVDGRPGLSLVIYNLSS